MSARRAAGALALTAVVVIAAVEFALALLRPEDGLAAVLQVIAPHLALLGLATAAVAVALAPRRGSIIVSLALLAIFGLRFGMEWASLPPAVSAGGTPLTIATWNLEAGGRAAADTVALVRSLHVDVIAVQELDSFASGAIEADAELAARFPYRALNPRADVLGLGVLSTRPLNSIRFDLDPAVETASLSMDGRRVVIVNAHPLHGELQTLGSTRLPIGIDVDRRNAELGVIRASVDAALAGRSSVVLVGDINTASSEPAFDRFVAGLRDVHAEIGEGTGWTWRPSRLEFLGLGFVRIDVVVVSPDLVPRGIAVVCPPAGDHCLVGAELALPSDAAQG